MVRLCPEASSGSRNPFCMGGCWLSAIAYMHACIRLATVGIAVSRQGYLSPSAALSERTSIVLDSPVIVEGGGVGM